MCFIESDWLLHRHTFGRRQLFGTGLAAGLAATAGLAGGAEASSLLPGLAVGAQAPPRSGGPGTSGVRFTWFGTNGWEITLGNKTILVDPWFVRSDIGFFSGKFNASAPLQVNEALINQHITRADQILIGHGHWDHIMEIPFIAKKTGAQVIGSETHANIMRAFGVEEGKIVQVKGGEVMQFDGYTIEVFPGLHSLGPTKKYAVPGHRMSVPTTPTTVGELPEGDTLIYLNHHRGQVQHFYDEFRQLHRALARGHQAGRRARRLDLRQPDPRLHPQVVAGAQQPEGYPTDPLGQFRTALLRGPSGSPGRLRRRREPRPMGPGRETGVAAE